MIEEETTKPDLKENLLLENFPGVTDMLPMILKTKTYYITNFNSLFSTNSNVFDFSTKRRNR